jgi:streptogramin lyase
MPQDRRPATSAAIRRAISLAALCLAGLTGCGSGDLADSSPISTPAVQGHVLGGQQPVANSRIILYAAGTNTTGGAPQDLFGSTTVYTNQNGEFNLPSIQCPAPTAQTYMVALHGNPGLTPAVDNQALVLMIALGDCQNVGANFISINEVTTAAAAWALAPFLGANAAVTSSATNATGLRNAFLTAQNLVDNATGQSPGANLPSGAVIESAKIYTLGNVLAPCVNSDGTTGCAPLFTAAEVGGVQPSNTLDAALNIVRNPGAHVKGVFDVAASKNPFEPALGTAPHDWTLSVTFKGGGLNQPGEIAVDADGNLWTPNYFNHALSEFSPVGQPLYANGIIGIGLEQSFGVAIDSGGYVWVSNENSVAGANNGGLGSVSRFSSQGTELSGHGYTAGGLFYPQGVAADSNGNIWIADYGDSSATLLNSNGGAISGSNGYAHSELPFTSALAIDASHNAWFAVEEAVAKVTPTGAVTKYSCCDDPEGVAVDQSGYIWLADYGGARVIKLSSNGTVEASLESPDDFSAAQGIAVDGAGNVFAPNFRGDTLEALTGSPAAIVSPSYGYGLDAPLNEPLGVAIDASGNVWVTNSGGNTITQFVGLASPVKTPMAGPPATP